MKKIFTAAFLLFATIAYAQKNFTYTPHKPKPGDVISFTYQSSGDLANSQEPVEAVVYAYGTRERYADDVILKRKGFTYTGTIATDTSQSFINVVFSVGKKYDNNYEEGYYIQLYDGENVKKGSYMWLSHFYQYAAPSAGVTRNNDKALAMIEKEMELFPDERNTHLPRYIRLLQALKKPDVNNVIQKEIETALKKGLDEEADYNNLESLYSLAKLPEQSKLITSLKKEKFPEGKWIINDLLQKFSGEKDHAKQKELLAGITKKVETDENWSSMKSNLAFYNQQLFYAYINKKDWAGFKKAMADPGILNKDEQAALYNTAAWRIQETGKDLELAEEFTSLATARAKSEWQNPTGTKPVSLTTKQWRSQKESIYAMYADTYAMVMYVQGKYKKGLQYAKDAAILIEKGQNPDENNTYALLAAKALPVNVYKKELEQFVKDGKSTAKIKEILKAVYEKSNRSADGFDEYITSLEKESYLKMLAELRKSMLNETAPSFALLDLSGNKVTTAELKGKIVVVDFWATWCGPCKASFPGMQKMVNKYSNNAEVKFIFVDTWERGDNKEKNARDFITSNKYSFHVLMDNDDKVVTDYKVDGIPTKFVIDKEGKIRFRAIGFDGSDDKLMSELTAMIDMASEASKKAF